jgi:hypothetical protein
MLRNWKYWHEPIYWRWWWRNAASRAARVTLVLGATAALLITGIGTAVLLAPEADSETITVQVVKTVGAQGVDQSPQEIAPLTPPLPTEKGTDVVTTFETITRPGETNVLTVRRKARTVVISKPGVTVTHAVRVAGPVQVVTKRRTDTVVQTQTHTNDRVVTVSTPGATETVLRTVTEPSPTVTQTHVVTVDRPVTVEVTVTETVRGPVCTAPPCN